MKVLILPDKENWAYDTIAKSLKRYNPSELKLEIIPIKGNAKIIAGCYKKFDRYLIMGWQNADLVPFLPRDRTFVGVHSHHSWDNGKTTPNQDCVPPKKLAELLNSFRGVNVVSERLRRIFSEIVGDRLFYTPNGVDTKLFKPGKRCQYARFCVGYSGSKSHDWRKGVSEYILPAAKESGAEVKLAMSNTDHYLPIEKMPSFYEGLNCYVCASSSEGFSLSVLEAAACGVPLVTTRVGGTDELVIDGFNALLVDRSVGDIADKIRYLRQNPFVADRLSQQMVQDIGKKWDWSIRAKDWTDFLSK